MLRKQIAADLRAIAAIVITEPDASKEALLDLCNRLEGNHKLRCGFCGNEHITRRLDKKYCSDSCRQAAYRERLGK